MGTQEPAGQITEVGTAFWYGFAFADLVFYVPLLIAGLIGHWRETKWTPVILGAALGITAYWPITALATIVAARESAGCPPAKAGSRRSRRESAGSPCCGKRHRRTPA